MSPRSLLFSSDEDTSHRMAQAFEELGLQVESCPDIFSALEKVTGERFDIVLADLDQGPEAAFLIKTARELKLNQSAFAFAVATGTAYAQPQEFGVELVLAKPIIPDQVKYALLGCDGFLARMGSWSMPHPAAKTQTAAAVSASESRPARWPLQPSSGNLPVRPAPPSPKLHPTSAQRPATSNVAPAASKSVSARPANPAPARHSPGQSAAVRPKARVSSGKILWSTTLGAAFLAAAYGASRPLPNLQAFAGSTVAYRKTIARAYDRMLEIARDSSSEAAEIEPAPADEETQAAAYPPSRVRASMPSTGRTTPVHRLPSPEQVSFPEPEGLPEKADPEPEPLPAAAHRAQIPDSIRASQAQTENDPVRSAAARAPSLLGQLEPVTLPDEIADELLSQKVQPNYPEQALKAGLQGAVVLQAWIGTDGNIRELKLVRGSLLLGQAAYKAVKQWRYKPYLLNGRAVEAQTFVTVNFRLPQQSLLLPSQR
jgi:TonB family protein